ncbi:hypothetical protein B0O99DRAFT_259744 [Bisporella sp. PMI_857]|nr:hypothetical protein B0O99DRAFT_259744 [Bisporella sp. PMI_857]
MCLPIPIRAQQSKKQDRLIEARHCSPSARISRTRTVTREVSKKTVKVPKQVMSSWGWDPSEYEIVRERARRARKRRLDYLEDIHLAIEMEKILRLPSPPAPVAAPAPLPAIEEKPKEDKADKILVELEKWNASMQRKEEDKAKAKFEMDCIKKGEEKERAKWEAKGSVAIDIGKSISAGYGHTNAIGWVGNSQPASYLGGGSGRYDMIPYSYAARPGVGDEMFGTARGIADRDPRRAVYAVDGCPAGMLALEGVSRLEREIVGSGRAMGWRGHGCYCPRDALGCTSSGCRARGLGW